MLAALGGASQAAAAPANDNFASAQVMTGAPPLTVAGNNIGATVEAGEPTIYSNTPLRTVWYRWTATSTGTFVVDTCNDGFTGGSAYANPMMGVRTGATLATLVNVAEINGSCSLRFSATVGTTYHLQIDYHDLEGNFNLTLRPLTPPANDNFASATSIGPALPLTANGTTVDSTFQAGEPGALGGSGNARSVWFNWTAPTTQRVRLVMCDKTAVDGPLNDSTYVFSGNTLATLVAVANTTSNDCTVDFPVTAGTTYRIGVSGSSKGEFTFQLSMQAAPPPANDNFATPQALGPGLPVSVTGNNDFATEEVGEPDDHGDYPGTSRSVWYSWTAGVTGPVRLKTCSRDLRFFTSVYTGNTLAALTEVSDGSNWTECSRYFDAVAGTTYRIAVAGGPFDSSHGPFDLNLHQVSLPPNDASAAAIDLGSGVAISRQGTTVDATVEDDEPNHIVSGGTGGSVWYRWTAPNDSPVIMSACSTEEANRITVYDEDPEPEEWQTGLYRLRQIDYDDEFCRGGEKGGRLAIAVEKGREYWIVVTPSREDYESPFTLAIQGTADEVITPKPPAFNLKKAIAKCKKIKGKGKKAKRKRANCIKAARKKAAIIKCNKIGNKNSRAKCVKKARKRFK